MMLQRPKLRRHYGSIFKNKNRLMSVKRSSYSSNTYRKTRRSRARRNQSSKVNFRNNKPPNIDTNEEDNGFTPEGTGFTPENVPSLSNKSNTNRAIEAISAGFKYLTTPVKPSPRAQTPSSARMANLNKAISDFSKSAGNLFTPIRFPRRNRKQAPIHNVAQW